MVVADEDPPRKRSKLSLKSSRKGESAPPLEEPPSLEAAGAAPQGPIVRPKTEPTAEDCPPPVLDLSQSDLPCDSCGVPPVASLENLGNTCFLNSVLEVLRYTPCFLEGLGELYRHIVYLEKVRAAASSKNGSEVKPELTLSWELVKSIYKTYKMMEKKEQMFHQLASADVTSMSVKPNKILDDIRYFNPMFEGNMQHDAQELLRCLLSYLEDAEKELHDAYTAILAMDPSLLKMSTVSFEKEQRVRQVQNSIMEKFLERGKSRWNRSSGTIVKQEDSLIDSQATSFSQVNSASDTGQHLAAKERDDTNCDSTDESCEREISMRLNNGVEADTKTSSSKRPVDQLIGNESCNPERIKENAKPPGNCPRPKRRKVGKSVCFKEEQYQDEVDACNTVTSSRHPAMGKKVKCIDHKDCKAAVSNQSPSKTRWSPRLSVTNVHAKCQFNSYDSSKVCQKHGTQSCELAVDNETEKCKKNIVVACEKKIQPTILSMFEKKRLGMRGGVARRSLAGSTPFNESKMDADFKTDAGNMRTSPRKHNGSCSNMISRYAAKGGLQGGTCDSEKDEAEGAGTSASDKEGLSPKTSSLEAGNEDVAQGPNKTACPLQPMAKKNAQESTATVECAERIKTAKAVDDKQTSVKQQALHTSSKCGSGSPGHMNSVLLSQSRNSISDTPKSCSEKPAAEPFTWDKSKLSSPAASNVSRGVCEGKSTALLQPGKLMIKLEKCDHVCNSPSISASAALKVLQAPSPACRRMNFVKNEASSVTTNSVDSDNEDDDVSLGTMGSFKSVPLKSVCIKVEKCDMVCNSPDKSVNAQFAATCLARQRAQRFNIIEKLFQGTMMMRTKCLECERCTERKESFQDVSVPLKRECSNDVDSESDEERDSSLLSLMHAFTDVEHLRDDNKYFCDHCLHYVEAERSLHYEALPNILTVHLKRFSASTGMFGCLSKINDHVTVPLQLSCLSYKCPKLCSRPDHRYTLFAIIMHAGSTITSGHYLSYIKVRPNEDGSPLAYDTLINYLNNSPAENNRSVDEHEVTSGMGDPSDSWESSFKGEKQTATTCHKGDAQDALTDDVESSGECNLGSLEYHWLECDDETIHILSEKEFNARLMNKESSLRGTPYVLFYHRLDTWKGSESSRNECTRRKGKLARNEKN